MDTYLPYSQAETYINKNILIELVRKGKIRKILANGIEMVSESDVMNSIPVTNRPEYQQFAHMAGQEISISEAARKYNIPQQTISRWAQKGFIARLGTQGRKTLIDESHIATRAALYHKFKGGQGKWIFDKDGSVYKKKN